MLFRPSLLLLFTAIIAVAYDGLDLSPPNSEPEAWNVIQLCSANIEKLVASKQWAEIPFPFRFYAPKPGYYRLYSQVQVGGTPRFAPFGLTVQP